MAAETRNGGRRSERDVFWRRVKFSHSSWPGQLAIRCKIRKEIDELTVSANSDINATNLDKQIKKIVLLGDLKDLTTRHLNRRVLPIGVALLILILGALQYFHIQSAKVQVDVKISSISFNVASASAFGRFAPLISNDSLAYLQDSASLDEGREILPLEKSSDLLLDTLRPLSPIKLQEIHFPTGAKVTVDNSVQHDLTIQTTSSEEARSIDSITWKIGSGPRRAYFEGKKLDLQRFHWLKFKKRFERSTSFMLTLNHPRPWKWPSRLFVKNLSFTSVSPGGKETLSSILAGRVALLETGDTVRLYERDKLDIVFQDSVELFLSGTGQDMIVHLEGDAKSVVSGPTILPDKENDRIPSILKYLFKATPWVWTAIGIITPLIISMFIRQRRAL